MASRPIFHRITISNTQMQMVYSWVLIINIPSSFFFYLIFFSLTIALFLLYFSSILSARSHINNLLHTEYKWYSPEHLVNCSPKFTIQGVKNVKLINCTGWTSVGFFGVCENGSCNVSYMLHICDILLL